MILFVSAAIIVISHNVLAGGADNIVDRRGRNVQIDGFLLEWKRADARQWYGTDWEWDAVITPNGIAGYFRPKSTPACTAWTFDITPRAQVIAADYESRTTEWLIADINTNKITITGSNNCGDTLPALVLTVNAPAASSNLSTAIIIALTAVLTLALIVIRRKSYRKTTV
jgi:hypothetical protein